MVSHSLNNTKSKSFYGSFSKKESMFLFHLLLFYLFLEYGRPQDILRFLSPLRLPALTIVLLGLVGFFSGRYRWDDKQTKRYLFLLGLMVIHGPIAVNNYWALMVFIAMVFNFIVYLSISNVIDYPEKYNKLIGVWLGIHLFLSVIGIIKGGKGIGGFLGDENDLCMTLNMIIPFSFFLALCATGRRRIYYILLTCLFLFVILLTGSRGGFVGLSATAIYCWFRTKRKALTAAIICILSVFVVLVAPTTYWDEIRTITGDVKSDESKEERIYTWRIGWNMFLANPVIGVGQGNFPYVFKKYEYEVTGSDEPFHGRSVAGRAAHSLYFTMLSELGIIGTFIYISMIFFNIKDLNFVKRKSLQHENTNTGDQETKFYHLALALEGSMISFLVSGAFISILYYPNFWILMGFIVSLRKIADSRVENIQPKKFLRFKNPYLQNR